MPVRPLKDLQDAILTIVADDDELIGVSCVGQDRGDIDAQIDELVAASVGLWIVWEVLGGDRRNESSAQDLQVVCTIHEDPTINRNVADYKAWDFVLMAVWSLFATPVGNANQPQLIRPVGWSMIDDTSGQPKVQIKFSTQCGWVRQ